MTAHNEHIDRAAPVIATMDIRLSYADCDPAGLVYFAAYYPFMERVYNEWTYTSGFAPSNMPDLWGGTHISASSGCDYLKPGVLFDPFTVELRLRHMGTTSFSIQADFVHRDTGDTHAIGHILFVWVDSETWKPKPIAEEYRTVFREIGYKV